MSNPTINATMTPAQWAMLTTLSIVWGGSFFFVGLLLVDGRLFRRQANQSKSLGKRHRR